MRICLLTNYCFEYRFPIFKDLSESYDIHFVFTENGPESVTEDEVCIRQVASASKLGQLSHLIRAKYDVMVCMFPPHVTWNGLLGFAIAVARRWKLIYWTEEWHEPLTLNRRALKPIIRLIVQRSDAIVTSGSRATAHMLDYGVASQKIFVAPNASWIDARPGRVPPAPALIVEKRFVILHLGRLLRKKGGDYLIRAFSRLERERDDVGLLIVGDGDFRTKLHRLARNLGIRNIEFVGACRSEDRIYYYDMCDVFVLPSIWLPYYCEAWGLTLNEAMQFGKPIITTDAVGAAVDLVKDGVNGFIVKNRDVESLYRALKTIADDRDLAKAMGTESRKIVQEGFTYERMAKGFRDAIAFVHSVQTDM